MSTNHGNAKSKAKFTNKPSLDDLLDRFDCVGLLDQFNDYLPLRQMHQARIGLVDEDDYIEVKHMADYVVSVKTRGQLGFLDNGQCSIIARFGHRVPLDDGKEGGFFDRETEEAIWLLDQYETAASGEEIELYRHISLEGYKGILKEEASDLVDRVSDRKVNTDFDFKRDAEFEDKDQTRVSPYTKPHKNLNAMLAKRAVMEKIRRRGENAPPAKVLKSFKTREQTVRLRNGVEATLVREFLRAVCQGEVEASLPETNQGIADAVTVIWKELRLDAGKKKAWTYSDTNNAKRPRTIEPGVFDPEPVLVKLLDKFCEVFCVDREKMHELLFSKDLFLYHLAPVARDVIAAILNGPRFNIYPFPQLSEQALLPSRYRLDELFGHVVPDIDSFPYDEYPQKRPTNDRSLVNQLFRRAGLDAKSAQEATTAIVSVEEKPKDRDGNPDRDACLTQFVQAIQQTDLVDRLVNGESIIKRLAKFGLTRSKFYEVKDERFVGHRLRRTSANRRQIKEMARALHLDPGPLLDALLKVGG